MWDQLRLSNDKQRELQNTLTDKDQEIGGLKTKLEETLKNLNQQNQTLNATSEKIQSLQHENKNLAEELHKIRIDRHQNIDTNVAKTIRFLRTANLYNTFLQMGSKLILDPSPANDFRTDDLAKLKAQNLIDMTYAGNYNFVQLSKLGQSVYKQILEESTINKT